jgi:hypothetical protein
LVLFIEPICDQHEIPPHGEAQVELEDGAPHSMDYHPENWVSLWDEGSIAARVRIFATHQFSGPKGKISGN